MPVKYNKPVKSGKWGEEAQKWMDKLDIYGVVMLHDIVRYKLSAQKSSILKRLEGLKGEYLIENIGIKCRKCGFINEKHIASSEGVYFNKSDVIAAISKVEEII